MGRSRGIAPSIGAALVAVGLCAAGAAAGAPTTVTCELQGHELRVASTGPDIVIARNGAAIRVADYRGPVECTGGPATVTSVDRIFAGGGDQVELDMRQGPLAPGATPEPDGSDEIEVTIGDRAVLRLDDDPRHVVVGEADDSVVVDLDRQAGGESEVDVRVPFPTPFKAEVDIRAGSGDDRISARGRGFSFDLRQWLSAFGGPGDDVLTASQSGEGLLAGGPGEDRLNGGRSNDFLDGNGGADELRAGRGRDFVVPGPGDDRGDCGRGRDVYAQGDGDRMRRCERLIG